MNHIRIIKKIIPPIEKAVFNKSKDWLEISLDIIILKITSTIN